MAMAEKTESPEPSMEEILASIRRIISEDGATVEAAPPPADSVLDLTEMLESEAAPSPRPLPPEPPSEPPAPANLEIDMEDNVPDMPVPEFPSAPLEASSIDERLVSDKTAQAAASAMSGLAQSAPMGGQSLPMGNGARTLESMVLEVIKPVLKEWLDRNLPILVERVVQKEIRKITREVG